MAGRCAISTTTQNKLVLAPEYGGDGGKKVGVCATTGAAGSDISGPLGSQRSQDLQGLEIPERLSGWRLHCLPRLVESRPGPQGGYNVVFQPLADGKPSGDYIVFADGFAGRTRTPAGPYIVPPAWRSDRMARFTSAMTRRAGSGGSPMRAIRQAIEAAPAPTNLATTSPGALPPEGVNPDAGSPAPANPAQLKR